MTTEYSTAYYRLDCTFFVEKKFLVKKLNFFYSRLAKEKQMYEKEVKDQSAKVEKMKADEKDEYDIKKQVCALFLQ